MSFQDLEAAAAARSAGKPHPGPLAPAARAPPLAGPLASEPPGPHRPPADGAVGRPPPAGIAAPPPSPSPTQPDSELRAIAAGVFGMTTAVAGYKKLADGLGTVADTLPHRARVKAAGDALASTAKALSDRLKAVGAGRALPPTAKAQQAKLAADFQACLSDFGRLQRTAAEREGLFPPREPAPPPHPPSAGGRVAEGGAEDEETGLLAAATARRQAMLRSDAEVAHNEALIAERQRGVAEIRVQIGEVNEIFRDLAVLVSDQGHQVDTMEANVTRAATHTRSAAAELATADKYQRASRWWFCSLALVAVVVVGVGVLLLALFI